MAVDAGSIFSEVRIRLDKLKGDIKQMDTLFDQVDEGTKGVEKKSKQMSLVAVAAFAAVGIAIQKLVTGSVKLFATFEQSLANVASVAQATPVEFEKITAAALEAGETTRFTATEAGDALFFLASAGFSASQSIEALEGVLNLAGATQSDLAFTSAAVAASISQFNLEAEDATKIANIFTAAITNSQATMEKLATSMRFVGPVASAFGLDIEEVTGALQILFNAGFEASTAGTALRSALADLSNEASPAIAKMKALGVSFEEVNPATNSFAEIIGVLSEKVTEGGQILSVFGDRAGPALIKLIQSGREGLEEYTAAVTDTNAAAEAYAVQNDTLAGSLDRLKSANQSVQIGFGELIGKALRPLVDLLTKALVAISKLSVPLKILFGVILFGIPIVIALTGAITALIPVITSVGVAMAGAFLPITIVVGALAAVTAGVVAVSRAVDKADLRRVKLEFGALADQLGITAEEMQDLVKIQREIGDERTLKQLNDFRLSLGLTAEEFRKLTRQARFFGVAVDSFAIAKTELGLTIFEAKNLDKVFEIMGRSGFDGSVKISDAVEVIANKFSLTTDQVIKFGLANDKLTGEYRNQLELLENQLIVEKEQAATQAEADAAHRSQLQAIQDQLNTQVKTEKEITKEKILQAELAQAELDEIFAKASERETARRKATRRQADAELSAGLITEEENIQKRLTAWENYFDAITGLQVGYADETGPAFQEAVRVIKELREQLSEFTDEEDKSNQVTEKSVDLIDERNQAYAETIDQIQENRNKLEELGASELELLEIQRERALAAIEFADIDEEFRQQAIDSTNELFDALSDDTANQNFIDNVRNAADQFKSIFSDLTGSVKDLNKAATDDKLRLLDEELQRALEVAGVEEETKLESLQTQLDAAKLAGDEETVNELENEIKRLQITQDFERQKAEVAYQAALVQWGLNIATASANAAQMILQGFLTQPFIPAGLAAGALATTLSGFQVGAVLAAKPDPPSFQTGGLILPSGSPQGRDIRAAEGNTAELLLNNGTSGESFLNEFADKVAARSNGGGNITVVLEVDGRKLAQSDAQYFNNGIVRLKL